MTFYGIKNGIYFMHPSWPGVHEFMNYWITNSWISYPLAFIEESTQIGTHCNKEKYSSPKLESLKFLWRWNHYTYTIKGAFSSISLSFSLLHSSGSLPLGHMGLHYKVPLKGHLKPKITNEDIFFKSWQKKKLFFVVTFLCKKRVGYYISDLLVAICLCREPLFTLD